MKDYKENEFKKLTPNNRNKTNETSSETDFIVSHFCYMQDNFYLFNLKKVQFTFKYAFLQEKDVELEVTQTEHI